MVDADHHNNLNIKGSQRRGFSLTQIQYFFWVEQTMECGIATCCQTGGGGLCLQNRVSKSFRSNTQEQPVSSAIYRLVYLPQNFRNDFSTITGSIKLIIYREYSAFFSARSSLQTDCTFLNHACINGVCSWHLRLACGRTWIRGIDNQIVVSRINVIQSVSNLRNFAFSG